MTKDLAWDYIAKKKEVTLKLKKRKRKVFNLNSNEKELIEFLDLIIDDRYKVRDIPYEMFEGIDLEESEND